MTDAGRIELESAGDGTRWRVRRAGGDVEGHMPFRYRFAVEDEGAEGHMPRIRNWFSLEPDGEDESGETLYRVEGEGDAEGHAFRIKGFSEEEQDAEGHARIRLSLEPTGEEEGGDPVFRVKADGDDAEGHAKRFFR
jgi:hypothetical protein